MIADRRAAASTWCPMADPVGCMVAQANASNVEHVLVGGPIRQARRRARRRRRGPRPLPRRRDPGSRPGRRPGGGPAAARVDPELDDLLTTAAAANLAGAWRDRSPRARGDAGGLTTPRGLRAPRLRRRGARSSGRRSRPALLCASYPSASMWPPSCSISISVRPSPRSVSDTVTSSYSSPGRSRP